MRTILTRTGRLVCPLALKEDDVDVLDVAWALAGEGRFSNHTCATFSVGQHSVQMARWALRLGYGETVAYQCLLHDAPEAYLGDIATPVKELFPAYREAEEAAWRTIARALHCPPALDHRVKELDRRALRTELRDLMPDYASDDPQHARDAATRPFPERLHPWPRDQAFFWFLAAYAELAPAGAPGVDWARFNAIRSRSDKPSFRPARYPKDPVTPVMTSTPFTHTLSYVTKTGKTMSRRFRDLAQARRFKQGILTAGGTAGRITPLRTPVSK
jgi:hypothetical protein